LVGTQLQDTRRPASTSPRIRADGSLSTNPPPLTLADIEKAPPGSATAAVLRLWYWGEWGSVPNILGAYQPAVIRALTAEDVAGAYALWRNSLQTGRPEVISELKGPRGSVVELRVRRRDSPPQNYSFTLRRAGKTWYVLYDTLLETAIQSYVQLLTLRDPRAKPTPAAVRAGVAAVRRFRGASAQ
jgi:hypothetical protein